MADLGVPTNSTFVETAVELFESMEFPDKSVMVLDDYHLLSSEIVDQFLECLVRNAPVNLQIVIISRSMFGQNTIELARNGYCHLIDKGQFAFTQDEIIEYYRLCGICLKPTEAAELYNYTEGWISALYLSMLSFLREGRIEHQVSLHELIEKVVYRQCVTDVKEFLLTICIFDSFTLEQARVMWPNQNVEAIINYLIANNALIKYDNFNKTYQMHNIFTSYLREILDQQDEKQRQGVWLLAGKWYASINDHIHAMECFYNANDFNSLLTILEVDKGHSIKNEQKERVIRYFHDCPPQIKKMHPWAGLIYAVYLFVFNERERFTFQCAEIAGYIEQLTQDDQQTKKQLAGEFELLLSFSQYNCIAGMTKHQQRAADLLNGFSQFIDKRASWTFGSPSVLYMYYRESGQLENEVNETAEAMPHYYRLTNGHGYGTEHVMQAERYYHIGDFKSAEIAANKAMIAAQSQDQTSIVLCALFLQMRLEIVRGNLSVVVNSLLQTREELKRRQLYSYIHTLDLCEGFVYACLDRSGKIPAWIVQGDVKDSSLYFATYAFFNIIWGKALLLDGQYLKLIGISGQFFGIADAFPNLLGHVYTHIYLAAAQYKLKRYAEAQESLVQAVNIASPDRLFMPFVENGEHILALLVTMRKDEQHTEFIENVRNLYAAVVKNLVAMRSEEENSDPLFVLTARELEIAGLVAAGMSNRLIADTLYVEAVTVKKTLQNAYAKLGISSRTILVKMMLERNKR